MEIKQLIIFVEGYYDELFAKNILFPLLHQYSNIQVIQYSKEKKEKINNYMKALEIIPYSDYLMLADSDGVAINRGKEKIQKIFNNLNSEKLILVVKEIEGWYISGLRKEDLEKLSFGSFDPNEILKEQFDRKIPTNKNKTTYLLELIEKFNYRLARENSPSFDYCLGKLCL